jgi:hypothetical protein
MLRFIEMSEDLNPKQLPAVARKCDSSQNPRLRRGVVRKTKSFVITKIFDFRTTTGVVGRGGAADPHGRTERSGVNSSRPTVGRSRGITFACDSTARVGTCGQNGEAAGLAPAVLHDFDEAIQFVQQNPAAYVIKPLGEVQNVKRLLYVGRDDDGDRLQAWEYLGPQT